MEKIIMKKHKTRKQKLMKKAKPRHQQNIPMVTRYFGYQKGQWVWCQKCNRCYQVGEHRNKKDGLEYCHYSDCNGDAFIEVATWETVRGFKPEYPTIPEKNKKYLLDFQLSGVWQS